MYYKMNGWEKIMNLSENYLFCKNSSEAKRFLHSFVVSRPQGVSNHTNGLFVIPIQKIFTFIAFCSLPSKKTITEPYYFLGIDTKLQPLAPFAPFQFPSYGFDTPCGRLTTNEGVKYPARSSYLSGKYFGKITPHHAPTNQ